MDLKDKNILFIVDNMSVVDILQSQTSKDLKIMMVSAMLDNIQFHFQHIKGKQS